MVGYLSCYFHPRVSVFISVLLLVVAAGCSTSKPEWVDIPPPTENGVMHFVGVSKDHAIIQTAWDDAHNNAAEQVVKYFGIDIDLKLNEAIVAHGLASDLVDPTVASIQIKEAMSQGVARRLKVQERYDEKLEGQKRVRSYALAAIPQDAVEQAYSEAMMRQANALRAKKRDEQVNNAIKMFDELAGAKLIPGSGG